MGLSWDAASEDPFSTLRHGHQDLVLAAAYNFYGNRLVTASSDHKLKVWDKKGDDWKLVDSWKAHDAEITDVRSLLFLNFRRLSTFFCLPTGTSPSR